MNNKKFLNLKKQINKQKFVFVSIFKHLHTLLQKNRFFGFFIKNTNVRMRWYVSPFKQLQSNHTSHVRVREYKHSWRQEHRRFGKHGRQKTYY